MEWRTRGAFGLGLTPGGGGNERGGARRARPAPPPAGPAPLARVDQRPPCSSLPLSTCVSPTSGWVPVMIPFTTSNSTTGRGVLLTM